MNQKIWGPHLWFYLHTITFNYPFYPTNDDKKNIINFFDTLKYTIPCSVCQKNYKRHLEEYPIKTNNRKELVYWLIDFHNVVNTETNKPKITYEQAIKIYENNYNCKIYLTEEEIKDDIKNGIVGKKCDISNISLITPSRIYLTIILLIVLGLIFIKKK